MDDRAVAREQARDAEPSARARGRRLRRRVQAAILARVSPEHTRRATTFERLTVGRLSWDTIVRCNRYLELVGKVATGIWVAFLVSFVVGFDWRETVEDALNSGRPVKGAVVLAVFLPTLLFLAAHSVIGFLRWRLQRELWRRDVERLNARDN
jgi:hypothetical protein